MRCFPNSKRGEDDATGDGDASAGHQESEDLRQTTSRHSAVHRDHVHDGVSGKMAVSQRLRELGATLLQNVAYDSLHSGELDQVFDKLLEEQPGYFNEVVLRIHQGQKS